MKKVLALALCVFALTATVVGCGGGKEKGRFQDADRPRSSAK